MNLIVAVDKNWAIGNDNKLLVSIPQDMKFFRETTMGKVVVMGRKTLESFPGGQPLKKRTNIVLTRDKNYQVKDAIVVNTVDELLQELKNSKQFLLFVKLKKEFNDERRTEIVDLNSEESTVIQSEVSDEPIMVILTNKNGIKHLTQNAFDTMLNKNGFLRERNEVYTKGVLCKMP